MLFGPVVVSIRHSPFLYLILRRKVILKTNVSYDSIVQTHKQRMHIKFTIVLEFKENKINKISLVLDFCPWVVRFNV